MSVEAVVDLLDAEQECPVCGDGKLVVGAGEKPGVTVVLCTANGCGKPEIQDALNAEADRRGVPRVALSPRPERRQVLGSEAMSVRDSWRTIPLHTAYLKMVEDEQPAMATALVLAQLMYWEPLGRLTIAGEEGRWFAKTAPALAAELRLSVITTKRAISNLRDRGFIRTIDKRFDGLRTNHFQIDHVALSAALVELGFPAEDDPAGVHYRRSRSAPSDPSGRLRQIRSVGSPRSDA